MIFDSAQLHILTTFQWLIITKHSKAQLHNHAWSFVGTNPFGSDICLGFAELDVGLKLCLLNKLVCVMKKLIQKIQLQIQKSRVSLFRHLSISVQYTLNHLWFTVCPPPPPPLDSHILLSKFFFLVSAISWVSCHFLAEKRSHSPKLHYHCL